MLKYLGERRIRQRVSGEKRMPRTVGAITLEQAVQSVTSAMAKLFAMTRDAVALVCGGGSTSRVEQRGSVFRQTHPFAIWGLVAVLAATSAWDHACGQPRPQASQSNSGQSFRPLMIDADQRRRLQRADELAAEARYDLAVPLWQKVLEDAGDQLMVDTASAETVRQKYQQLRPVSSQIEATIAKLPPAGLREYRLLADAEARSLLAAATDERREAVLAEVVVKYFLSSVGDEVAFELACLQLERQEYHAAMHLLEKLKNYPGSKISQGEVLLRLAVAQARVGDGVVAQETLQRMAKQGELVTARNLQLVSEDVQQARKQSLAVAGWPMRYGTAAHDGHMRGLPAAATSTGYSEMRQCRPDFPLLGIPELPADVPKIYMSTKGQTKQMIYINGVIIDPDVYERERTLAVNRHEIVERWKKRGGNLVGDALFVGDKVIVDGGDRVVCYDAQTGAERWQGHPRPYDVDELSKSSLLMKIADQRYGYRAQTSPYSTFAELQLFGDSIHHAMASAGGRLFLVAGDLQSDNVPSEEPEQQRNWLQLQEQGIQRRRQNWLAAYDLNSGKLAWNRSAAPGGEERAQAGFLCAPVADGPLLVVPVTADGKCWLFGLRAADGVTVWRTLLGDEPTRTTISAARASVAVDAGEAFVSSGIGTTYCVDTASGTVKWGVRYAEEQLGQDKSTDSEEGKQPQRVARNDTVIVTGNQVIVMPSDFDHVFALQRRTGEIRWQQPLEPVRESTGNVEYCIGVHHAKLYVAGAHVVRAIDTSSGEVVWQQTLQGSFGRGAITENAVFVPDGRDVVQWNLDTGQVLARTPVVTTTNEPLGNLYSDGQQLWVCGVGRLYALGDLQQRLVELNQKIDEGDGRAYLNRSRIYCRLEKYPEALVDLKAGYAILLRELSPAKANQELFEVIDASGLADAKAVDTLQWVVTAASSEQQEKIVSLPSRDRVMQALFADPKQLTPLNVQELLAIAPYCRTNALAGTAEKILAQIVTVEDEAVLRNALQQKDPMTRRVAQAGLVVALRKAAKPRLLQLLESKNENERLVGAAALAADAQREALPALGNLLTSRDEVVRERAISLLRQLTGKSFQYDAKASVYRRRRATTNWQAWINREGQSAPLRTAQTKPADSTKFTPLQVDALINGGQLIDTPE